MQKRTIVITLAVLAMMITGCPESEQQRLVEMAERQLEQQAEQSRRMAELQREVAEGSRQLVEADARAREEIVALQRDIQAERSEITFDCQLDICEPETLDLLSLSRIRMGGGGRSGKNQQRVTGFREVEHGLISSQICKCSTSSSSPNRVRT